MVGVPFLRTRSRSAGLLAIGLLAAALSSADDRTEPIDIAVALDKSLSMVEEIGAVRQWLRGFIDEQLIVGDHLHLLLFYGNADVAISQEISSTDARKVLDRMFGLIEANGSYTDIGNALDALRGHLESRQANDRRKTVLLLTDGKQEAPPGSPYSSADGSIDHDYWRRIVDTIPRAGWNIHVIGVGDQSIAREVAESLAATFDQVDTSDGAAPLEEQLAAITEDLLARVDVVQPLELSAVRRNGAARATFSVAASSATEARVITVRQFQLASVATGAVDVLAEATTITVPPAGEVQVNLPLLLEPGLEPGTHLGTVTIAFADGPVFTPARFDVEFRVRTFWQDFWWAIVLAVAILAVLIGGGVLALLARGNAGTIAFRISVENQRRSAEEYRARSTPPLFLVENDDLVQVVEARTAKAVMEVMVGEQGLERRVLRASSFIDPEGVSIDGFGPPVRLRLTSGRRASVQLIKAD
jgi:hypothetical protein